MGASLQTPYDILEVAENANYNQIRIAFRKHIHAFKRGEISNKKFSNICWAFECLSDQKKRQYYDKNKRWSFKPRISSYSLQQLAAEHHLLETLKTRSNQATQRTINAQDPNSGHTALYCAARTGNLFGVIYLLGKGAEPDVSQRTKSTALHVSAFYGHADIVRCLLENGADYRIKNQYNNVAEDEAYDGDITRVFSKLKQNPFVQAAADQLQWFKDNLENISEHIDHQYFLLRQTLLHCACRKGYFDLVQWLVEQRSCNLDIVDINLNSALHHACYGGHSTIVEYLLNHGANSLLINKWRITAEQGGQQHGNKIKEIFETVRGKNMFDMAINGVEWWFQYHFGNNSPNATNAEGTSLLYIACRYGHTSIAKWLLDHGANVNIQLQQGTGSTPLHGAAFHGHVSTVELLLAYGADVNIKNNYGATVFDEDTPNTIKMILEQNRRNLKDDKLMPVHIYVPDKNEQQSIVKVYLHSNAKQNDLIEALPMTLHQQNGYFSIAKRPLWFESNETTVLTAVCHARYVRSRFIEIPLRLMFSYGKPTRNEEKKSENDLKFDSSKFEETFEKYHHSYLLNIKPTINSAQIVRCEDLSFTIKIGSNDKDVSIEIQYLKSSNLHDYVLPGCLGIFKITYESRTRLKKPPAVSFLNQPNARLYTLAFPSSYWFTYDTRQNRLPMVEGIYGFFHHVEIIPRLLCLPADIFLAMTLGKPLLTRNHPVPCKYFELRSHNIDQFPLTAYHGTRIDVIQSILTDGLVVPGTIVANGTCIKPPANHIPLYMTANNISNFAGAIFVSPSIYYSSDPVYSTSFEYEGKRLLPVLECSVKTGSYTMHRSTLPQYETHPTDNIQTIEWRVDNPMHVEINAVLFLIKEFDQCDKI